MEPSAEPGVATVAEGLVRGVHEGKTWVFRGVPYAAPPTGDRRWKAPEAPACIEGVLDAASFGPVCPQIDTKAMAPVGSEDCLTLNIWTPDDVFGAPQAAPVPVLFFIHGGANIQGSASEPLLGGKPIYDGKRLSEATHSMVVTIQYRLGPLGFLALPELSAEAPSKASGNYGLLDQIAALTWVRDNIGALGGDAGRVMLFGESAGALDTCALLASPAAKGLFSAALMQSGGCIASPIAAAEAAMSARVNSESTCGGEADRLACLRAKTAAEILQEIPGSSGIGGVNVGSDPASYAPIVDGAVLPAAPLDAIEAGTHNHVPFGIGTNAEELAKMLAVQVSTEAEYTMVITASFGPIAQDVLAAYPAGDYATPQEALVAVYSDLRFTCPARKIARSMANSQTEPVWRYFFTRRPKTIMGSAPASHAIELPYVFGTLSDITGFSPDPADLELSGSMMGYWGNFAAKGDPNGGSLSAWPKYDAAMDSHLVLDSPISSGQGVREAQCDFWEGAL